MKIIKSITALSAALFLLLPVCGFAMADIGIYGGYAFNGSADTPRGYISPSGPEYGAAAHLTFSLPLLATLGAGGFYQYSPQKFILNSNEYSFRRTIIGMDAFAQIDLPVLPLKPFGRVTAGAYDRISAEIFNSIEYFKNYSAGGGLAWEAVFSGFKLNIYAEYLYSVSLIQGDKKNYGHAVHLGTKAGL